MILFYDEAILANFSFQQNKSQYKRTTGDRKSEQFKNDGAVAQ